MTHYITIQTMTCITTHTMTHYITSYKVSLSYSYKKFKIIFSAIKNNIYTENAFTTQF